MVRFFLGVLTMKVVLLTHESETNRALANLIKDAGINLTKVVMERRPAPAPPSSAARLRRLPGALLRRLRTDRRERLADKTERRYRQAAERIIAEFLADKDFPAEHPAVEYVYARNAQSERVLRILRADPPDLFAVFGAPILKAPILAIPKLGAINAHTALLPEYRGSRSEFFQCCDQNYDHVGVTFHFIDAGVDTGDIICQRRTTVDAAPEPQALRAKNLCAVLSMYPRVIKKVLNKEATPKPQGKSVSPTYRFKHITREKRLQLYSRIGKAAGL